MPPNQGWIVFHTPKAPKRIRWPMPSSMRNSGIPSNTNIIMKGIRKAPEMETKMSSSGCYIRVVLQTVIVSSGLCVISGFSVPITKSCDDVNLIVNIMSLDSRAVLNSIVRPERNRNYDLSQFVIQQIEFGE